MTLDQIKELIKAGKVQSDCEAIETGMLRASSGKDSEYSVRHGWDIASALECDEAWGKSNLELFEYIDSQDYSDDELNEILSTIQMEDQHWSWFKKSVGATSNEYEWFFLYANERPQGACLIYHPKESALRDSNIFYVEFLAVAPWNRDCALRNREFCGVGSILLKAAQKYSTDALGLEPGFSLHSLPQASGYYLKLQMVNVAIRDKESMLYFELPINEAEKFMGAA